jgi:chloramphenicol 3-O phosphotransferase
VILNGVPRSGKSSIVAAIQESFDGVWLNVGVDVFMRMTPEKYRPGIGLRPGNERPDLAPIVPVLFATLYGSIAAHSREGSNVVVDIGHYDTAILVDCARRLNGLPVLFVGVRCPIEEIMRRRNAGEPGRDGLYVTGSADDPIPLPVRRWQDAVGAIGPYDIAIDTSVLDPDQCAAAIQARLRNGPAPTAFARLAAASAN